MMTVNHALLILEDVVEIFHDIGVDGYYLDQVREAVEVVTNALPDEIKSQINREGFYVQ